jgi:hypothetical protein
MPTTAIIATAIAVCGALGAGRGQSQPVAAPKAAAGGLADYLAVGASASASLSGGTQSQNVIGATAVVTIAGRMPTDTAKWLLRVRGEDSYTTAQKPGQARVTAVDMRYLEFRPEVRLRNTARAATDSTPAGGWTVSTYGIASGYHHIAFDLKLQKSYGAGLSIAVPALSQLAVSGDVRHIDQAFGSVPPFSSWAGRVHQSLSHRWTVGMNKLPFTVGETVEVILPFETAQALQTHAGVEFIIPVVKSLSIPLVYATDYVRNAPPGFRPRYWKSSVQIRSAFGNP